MNLGIKVSSTKVTNEAKSYMKTPHMHPKVRTRVVVSFANAASKGAYCKITSVSLQNEHISHASESTRLEL